MTNKPTKMKNIVIFGAPGSGKGTQSDLLIAKYGLGHISTGDVLRREIAADTALGRTAKGYTESGRLIPDALMTDILAGVYASYGDDHEGVIFDGYPRTIPQAVALKTMLARHGHSVAAMIEIAVSDEALMERLIKRGRDSGRADDNAATIRKRLDVYHTQTQPLVDWYAAEGLHHRVDGFGDIRRIFSDICDIVDKL